MTLNRKKENKQYKNYGKTSIKIDIRCQKFN